MHLKKYAAQNRSLPLKFELIYIRDDVMCKKSFPNMVESSRGFLPKFPFSNYLFYLSYLVRLTSFRIQLTRVVKLQSSVKCYVSTHRNLLWTILLKYNLIIQEFKPLFELSILLFVIISPWLILISFITLNIEPNHQAIHLKFLRGISESWLM